MFYLKKLQISQFWRSNYSVVIIIFFLLACRLLAMTIIPLNDTTEAHYAEIARKMLETNNWITPLQDYGVPCWSKPPLSTWLSAFSMKLFGVNEIAPRLPSLFFSIGILWLVWHIAKKHNGLMVAANATLLLACNVYFILDAGTVMTDPSLLFCTTLAMVAFWFAITTQSKVWQYLFFIGLGLGLLAKGPIILVLTGMPIFVWIIIRKQWQTAWKNLPWIKGTFLMLLISIPWYVIAEIRTPGFLNYFIIGEHFSRYFIPGWDGDKYGFAHLAPYGMIWIYAFIGLLPWSISGSIWLIRHRKKTPALCRDNDGWVSYLLLFILLPLLFFTFARNIIYPYVFPSIPPIALLMAELSNRAGISANLRNQLFYLAGIIGIALLIGVSLFWFEPQWVTSSQKPVLEVWRNQHPSAESNLIYWAGKTKYSAQFYSDGKVKATLDPSQLCRFLSNHSENYLVVNSSTPQKVPVIFLSHLTKVASIKVLKETFTLYRSDIFNYEKYFLHSL